MAAWVIPITGKLPKHWKIAQENRFWDMTKSFGIKNGDDVFFWIGAPKKGKNPDAGFAGWATAVTDETEIGNSSVPWSDPESGYRRRFHFRLNSNERKSNPRWTEVTKNLNTNVSLQTVRGFPEPHQATYLQSLFKATSDVAPQPAASVAVDIYPVDELYQVGDDVRTRSQRMINIRRGQGKFRDSLIDRYDARCTVTGSPVLAVLEAAHIDRYFGDHSHHVTNGLLLRAAIHTLFDLLRITVDENLLIRIDPKLTGTEYEPLDGAPLRLPANQAHHPNMDALRRHRESCTWMPKAPATA